MQATSPSAAHAALKGKMSRRVLAVEYLDRVVDSGLAAIIFVAPLFMGGRGAVGRLVLVGLVALTACGWFLRQCLAAEARWRWSGAELLILLGAMLVVVQLIPFSPSLLNTLSPAIGKLLPFWSDNGQSPALISTWETISLTPEETRGGLVMFLTYALLFVVVVNRIDSVQDVCRLLRWIAFAGLGMACLGLAQFLVGNGKFLWVFEHPSRNTIDAVKGAFQNQNHFAHFLALALGPLMYCLYEAGVRRKKASAGGFRASFRETSREWDRVLDGVRNLPLREALMVGIAVVIFAVLLTYSRGGMLAMFVALAACVVIFSWKSLVDRTTGWILASVAAMICCAIFIFGHDTVAHELSTLWKADSLQGISRGRASLWQALIEAIPHFARIGSGIGSHREVYPIFMEEHFDFEFTHGESGYLPLLLEAGIPGIALMIAGILLCHSWCWRAIRAPQGRALESGEAREKLRLIVACGGAVWPGLICSVVHSVGDFVWYIPACMSITLILAACACRLSQMKARLSDSESSRRHAARGDVESSWPWTLRLAAAGCVLICACALVQNRVGPARAASHWNAYLKIALAGKRSSMVEVSERRVRLAAMEQHLAKVLEHDPHNARANFRYGTVCLQRFELEQQFAVNSMALSQIRDAAFASNFSSKQAQDEWLSRAVGDNRRLLDEALIRCRTALLLSPLQGVAYLHMADLAFLESPRDAAKDAYLRQAVLVRPHSGQVQFALGREAALAGDHVRAIEYWKRAFRQDPDVQQQIIESLSGLLPPPYFLSTFRPDTAGLWRLYGHYQAGNRLEDARQVGLPLAEALIREAQNLPRSQAAYNLHQAQSVYAYIGEAEKAVACEIQSVELTPNDYERRRVLAALLLQTQQYADAVQQLEWCVRRHPEDRDLRQELAAARKHVMER